MNELKVQANRAHLRPIICLIVAVALLFAPLVYRFIFQIASDFPTHNDAIVVMLQTRDLPLPHFLYHFVVVVLWKLLAPALGVLSTNVTAQVSAVSLLTQILFYEFIAVILYFQIHAAYQKAAADSQGHESAPMRVPWRRIIITALSLMMVGPVLLLWPIDHQRYLGYIATNAFHNPTMPVLKPFALLLFAWATTAFVTYPGAQNSEPLSPQKQHAPWRTWLVAAVLTWLSALAKPSYIICLLPAVLLYAAYRCLRRRRVDLALLGWGIVVPTGLLLAWQFWFTYQNYTPGEADNAGVFFAPLAAMSAHSTLLLPKFLCSIFFPVAVYVLYFQKARRDVRLNLAWLTFGFAAFYSYFMAEAARVSHGNFVWSGQIALFILFLQSMAFLIQETSFFDKTSSLSASIFTDRKLPWCLAIYSMHLFSGLYYYIHLLTVAVNDPNPYA